MTKTKYLKMECPKCHQKIDHVEEIGSLIVEGTWRPVISEEEYRAFGSSERTVSHRIIRCPKCKFILRDKGVCFETITGLTHSMVKKAER